PPVVISDEASGVKNGSGFNPRARCRPLRAISEVTSSSSAGTPALAKWAAICAPMVPAPSTATDRKVSTVKAQLSRLNAQFSRVQVVPDEYRAGLPPLP